MAEAGADDVVAAGRGAGTDLEPYRRLAERHGARFAVTRPHVEAGPGDPAGAGGGVVGDGCPVALRRVRRRRARSAHVVGMAGSGTVIAVNLDPDAPIFEHADLGAVADAAAVAAALERA